ncbi:MAG: hypothetical protein K9L68_10650 [Spirochaetales bacterium]|nr:hypothetical protein [Spirochaetales bacterium]MCF7939043.1 hypothetical protein [Spirochaetales bacterium]
MSDRLHSVPADEGAAWDDLRVSANMMHIDSSQFGESPDFVQILTNTERGPSYSGLFAYRFSVAEGKKSLIQNGHFQAQLPHSYREGSDIEPHVHIRLDPLDGAAAGQNLLLEFEYSWVNLFERRPESSTIISINYRVSEEDLSNDNILVSFGPISKPDARISSMLTCRFSRIHFNPDRDKDFWTPKGLTNDTFVGNMIFMEFDFHYQKDNLGSSSLYTK